MNKNSILKSGFILPLAVAGSALKIMFTMRPKSNSNLNTHKLFKYNVKCILVKKLENC